MQQSLQDSLFMLSKCLAFPGREFAGFVHDGTVFSQVMQSIENLVCGGGPACGRTGGTDALLTTMRSAAASARRQLEGLGADEVFHVLRVEYTNLFIGLPSPAVSPYESVQRGTEQGRRVLLMVDDIAAEVRAAYREQGIVSANRNEPDDHISLELEFAGYLAVQGDEPAYNRFVDAHLRVWADAFANQVMAQTCEGSFYRFAASALLAAFPALYPELETVA